MKPTEFNLLFDKLVSNPWRFPLVKGGDDKIRSLFFNSFKNHETELIAAAFRDAIKEQKYFPCVQDIENYIKANEIHMPQVKVSLPPMPPSRAEAIKDMMAKTRECILKHGNDTERLLAISNEFRTKRNLSGATLEDLSTCSPRVLEVVNARAEKCKGHHVKEVSKQKELFKTYNYS